jgi:hypothetical protein
MLFEAFTRAACRRVPLQAFIIAFLRSLHNDYMYLDALLE